MASYIYPAVFHYNDDDGSYTIRFPDLECTTEGKSLENALYMAQDLLTGWVEYCIEKGNKLPLASRPQDVSIETGEFVNLIRAELKEGKAVRRTVSLPERVDKQVTAAGLSLSRILQDALRERYNFT